MNPPSVAVFDVGKSKCRLTLVDRESGDILHERERVLESARSEALRDLPLAAHESFLIESLRDAPGRAAIVALVPAAHGAAAALLDSGGSVLAAPDYESPAFDAVTQAYRLARDPYSETYSPLLPRGLNLARQWFFFEQQDRSLYDEVSQALPYPQYWAWRMSGVRASEITSLGCHTDLWRPVHESYSMLARERGWEHWLPPLRRATDVLGEVSPEFAKRTGLDRHCKVHCGIHDSNASYYAQLAEHPDEQRFAVVSSGTWTIVMARGAAVTTLDEGRDMLANIDALGNCVPTARFMGGRDYELIAGASGLRAEPDPLALAGIVRDGAMALPAPSQVGRLRNADALDGRGRAALASLYCALMTDQLLELLGADGPVRIDGPLARNECYLLALAALRPSTRVESITQEGQAMPPAAALAGIRARSGRWRRIEPRPVPGLHEHRAEWRRLTSRESS